MAVAIWTVVVGQSGRDGSVRLCDVVVPVQGRHDPGLTGLGSQQSVRLRSGVQRKDSVKLSLWRLRLKGVQVAQCVGAQEEIPGNLPGPGLGVDEVAGAPSAESSKLRQDGVDGALQRSLHTRRPPNLAKGPWPWSVRISASGPSRRASWTKWAAWCAGPRPRPVRRPRPFALPPRRGPVHLRC